MIHKEQHESAGKDLVIISGEHQGKTITVEDWWDRVAEQSWMDCNGNPACLIYAMRSGFANMPIDNEVFYGKIGGLGHIIHQSEVRSFMWQEVDKP